MNRSEEVLINEPWDFMVFSRGGNWILTYFVEAAASYSVSIHLDTHEVNAFKTASANPRSLVEAFRINRETYQHREIHPPVWPSASR